MKRLSYLPIALLALGCLFAAKVWEDKPASEWSEKETLSVMERSPWTKKKVDRGHPGRSLLEQGSEGGLPPNRTFFVSFTSAFPFRQALARWAVLSQAMKPAEAASFLEQPEFEEYVIVSVWGPGGQDMSELEEITTESLQESTFLELKGSRTKIPLSRYLPPSETGSGEGLFYFPRSLRGRPLVSLAEDEVKFETRLSGRIRLSLSYKLKDMLVNGQLEL